MRKTKELAFSNIDYKQADILELNKLDRRFNIIESLGVLHHLKNPLEGWKVLVDLLQPQGLMKIALYSEIARQSVVEARKLIIQKQYGSTSDDIR
jgi:2-polyprenyl-3-methyl-5-hydroxy-6-metoxy-1,4-benzoquinol methylase